MEELEFTQLRVVTAGLRNGLIEELKVQHTTLK